MKTYKLLVLLAVVVLGVGTSISWRQYQANRTADQKAHHLAASGGQHRAPTTTKPQEDEFSRYTVAPGMPRYLFIPSISVRAMVTPLGVAANNQVNVPSNIFNVGWYNKSAKPGQPGAMLMDGHVSSWTTHGVFYDLKKLKPGDALSVEGGDGVTLHYKVVKNQTYDDTNVDMAAALQPVNPQKPGLNLITCSGSVKKGTNEFDKRIVVFAEQE